jgi:hypothetical protein
MRPGAIPLFLLLAGIGTAAICAETPAKPAKVKDSKAIGPKPDDPRQAKDAKAIGPKPDDPGRGKKPATPANTAKR